MKEQLERDIKILREAKQISVNNHDYACGVNIKALETQLTDKLKSLDTKEQQDTDLLKESIDLVSKAEELAFKASITDKQSLSNQFFRLKNRLVALKHKGKVKEPREFKNKDFHVKVWQDSERIYGESVWIREGYEYNGNIIDILSGLITSFGCKAWFGDYKTFSENERCLNYSYSDIVAELEKADKLSKEVSIWDVIEECKGVMDSEGLDAILSKYEYTTDYVTTYELNENVHYLDNPLVFVKYNYQLRLKGQK